VSPTGLKIIFYSVTSLGPFRTFVIPPTNKITATANWSCLKHFGMDRVKSLFHYCFVLLLRWKQACLRSRYLDVKLFVSRSLPSNDSVCNIAPSSRLFDPNSLQACRHFCFSKGSVFDICDRSRLPSPSLGSHGGYSPTDPAAPNVRPHVPSDSLIMCEPIHVYHNHLRLRVPLNLVHLIIHPCDYISRTSHEDCNFGDVPFVQVRDRATLYHPRSSPHS
jgi:hypothetical protein